MGSKKIGVSTPPLTDTKFEEMTFYVLEISCSIILGMTFLHDFSIVINPRKQTLTLSSVEGTYLRIPSETRRKLPADEAG